MSTQTASAVSVPPVVAIPVSAMTTNGMPTVCRFSVETYHRMIESGALTESDRVQLIDGLIIEMPPIGPQHFSSTMLVEAVIRRKLPVGWVVRPQGPITLEHSEPEPDIVVARGELRDYLQRHPGSGDVALVIEIADSTLDFDRQQKTKIYAEAAIPHYWILNLVDRQLEVHRDPQAAATGADYRFREVINAGGTVNLVLNDRDVAQLKVSDLLP